MNNTVPRAAIVNNGPFPVSDDDLRIEMRSHTLIENVDIFSPAPDAEAFGPRIRDQIVPAGEARLLEEHFSQPRRVCRPENLTGPSDRRRGFRLTARDEKPLDLFGISQDHQSEIAEHPPEVLVSLGGLELSLLPLGDRSQSVQTFLTLGQPRLAYQERSGQYDDHGRDY